MNKTAKFWEYTGNHPDGRDCERHDPHGFGLALIAYMAGVGDGEDYQPPLTYADTQVIKVQHHKGNDFGHEITVKAPQEVWERGAESLKLAQSAWT